MRRAFWIVSLAAIWSLIDYPFGLCLFLIGAAWHRSCFALMVVLALAPVATLANPIEPGAMEVVDGDTIRAGGRTVRLVGFDAPETGSRARCEFERRLGAAASRRLRQLVAGGGLDLELVACSCRPGTEGTMACNYGRACGTLKARGRDVWRDPD